MNAICRENSGARRSLAALVSTEGRCAFLLCTFQTCAHWELPFQSHFEFLLLEMTNHSQLCGLAVKAGQTIPLSLLQTLRLCVLHILLVPQHRAVTVSSPGQSPLLSVSVLLFRSFIVPLTLEHWSWYSVTI